MFGTLKKTCASDEMKELGFGKEAQSKGWKKWRETGREGGGRLYLEPLKFNLFPREINRVAAMKELI